MKCKGYFNDPRIWKVPEVLDNKEENKLELTPPPMMKHIAEDTYSPFVYFSILEQPFN